MNKKVIINILKVVFSITFVIFILNYFFGQNSESLQRDLLKVDYLYVFMSMLFGGIAYVNRGFRWVILINAIGYNTTKTNSVSAVSIGYFTNLFIPRAGEISRCTALKKSDDIPVDKLFGTILIERVLDFVFLIAFIIISFIWKSAEIARTINEYQRLDSVDSSNTKFIILLVIFILTFLIYIFRYKIKQLSLYHKVLKFVEGLKEGFMSIKKMKNKSTFWFHTFSIWIMYFLMTYICFYSIPETSHLGVSDGLFLLVLGGIGMVVPAPGGIGSYHLIVMIGLVALQIPDGSLSIKPYDDYNPAMLFPFVIHTAQTFVAILMGSIGVLMLFRDKKKIN